MPRRLILMPVLGLVAAVVAFALLLGGRTALTTPTEVIARMAARYQTEAGAGASASDCAARPAQSDGLWLVVSCEPADGARFEYFLDGYGRLVHANRPEGRS